VRNPEVSEPGASRPAGRCGRGQRHNRVKFQQYLVELAQRGTEFQIMDREAGVLNAAQQPTAYPRRRKVIVPFFAVSARGSPDLCSAPGLRQSPLHQCGAGDCCDCEVPLEEPVHAAPPAMQPPRRRARTSRSRPIRPRPRSFPVDEPTEKPNI
jgi:hypothetical protein